MTSVLESFECSGFQLFEIVSNQVRHSIYGECLCSDTVATKLDCKTI